MSTFKTTFSRALTAIKSDNANIPYPSEISAGTNTSVTVSSLVDSSATFNTKNVKTGDIVYNTTDGTAATVISVVNQTTLLLNADIFTATDKAYVVYAASSQTGSGNQGCYLYVGGAGNVSVVTIGNDIVTFFGVVAGTTLPIQVLKLRGTATTATNIVALW